MSGRIYQIARLNHSMEFYQKIKDRLEGLEPGSPAREAELTEIVNELTLTTKQLLDSVSKTDAPPWDFSAEKNQTEFASDGTISLCPITPADEDFYCRVRAQHSLSFRALCAEAADKRGEMFVLETLSPAVFYCSIRRSDTGDPIGFLGIKDTSDDLWELAIELDDKYTQQGFGPRSIRLYLNEIQHITGKKEYRALVEVDNTPSQKCFERLGAKFVGLQASFFLRTEEERDRFEEKNLGLLNEQLTELAERLNVAPRKLLSHILDYRLECPL